MNILTSENTVFNLDTLPAEPGDIQFGVLDNSKLTAPDYYFRPLTFLENFTASASVLRIGEHVIKMPLDWLALIGEPDCGDLEVIPLTSLNDRGFKMFQFNPISGFRPTFLDLEIIDVYRDVEWFAPRLTNGQLLCIPLTNDPKPLCVYFVKKISRNLEVIDYSLAW